MNKNKTEQKIEDALSSLDGAYRATPNPFLLTRINARLQQQPIGNFWLDAFNLIRRPVFVGICLLVILIVNVAIITQRESAFGNNASAQNSSTVKYDFAINVSSIYDIENQ